MRRDAFGDRMKTYEAASDFVLPARLPVIIRLDGNSFSKFTDEMGFKKPFDSRFDKAMNDAATAALRYTHGLVAYVQSDEITILLRNDRSRDETPLLGNRVQKLASLVAAAATAAFNHTIRDEFPTYRGFSLFDARVFVVPPSEVNNVFLWRQKDAFKNCVGAYAWYGLKKKLGRSAAQKMLHAKSTKERQEILFQELGLNINDVPTAHRRGRAIRRVTHEAFASEVMPHAKFLQLLGQGRVSMDSVVKRSNYQVDAEIPEFNVDPEYLGKFMR